MVNGCWRCSSTTWVTHREKRKEKTDAFAPCELLLQCNNSAQALQKQQRDLLQGERKTFSCNDLWYLPGVTPERLVRRHCGPHKPPSRGRCFCCCWCRTDETFSDSFSEASRTATVPKQLRDLRTQMETLPLCMLTCLLSAYSLKQNIQLEVDCCLQTGPVVVFQISCWTSKVSRQWWSLRRSVDGWWRLAGSSSVLFPINWRSPHARSALDSNPDHDDCRKLLQSSSCFDHSIFSPDRHPGCFALSALEPDLFVDVDKSNC